MASCCCTGKVKGCTCKARCRCDGCTCFKDKIFEVTSKLEECIKDVEEHPEDTFRWQHLFNKNPNCS